MNKTGVIIQARTGSTRLPNKIILPFYKEKSILDIIIEEIKKNHQELTIILATSTNPKDQVLKEIAIKHNVVFYEGSEDNVLSRFVEASEQYDLTHVVRVCADNPFLQGSFMLDLIANVEQYDYTSFAFEDGTPSILSHIGLFAESTSLEALKKVAKATKDPLYLEHVTNYIHGNEKEFNLTFLPIQKYIKPNKNIRFTLDTIEDFELLQKLYLIYIEKLNKDINLLISYIENDSSILSKMKLEIENNTK